MTKTVFVVNDGWVSDFDDHLQNVIKKLSEYLKKVPEEYRDTARLDFDICAYGNGDVDKSYNIFYVRPETAEEEATRLQKAKETAMTVEQKELAQLKILLEKHKDKI